MVRNGRLSFAASISVALPLWAMACNTGPKEVEPRPEPKSATTAPAPSPVAASTSEGALRLGSPIEASAALVAFTDVVKTPSAFAGKKFATTGTVTAVCHADRQLGRPLAKLELVADGVELM
jgi:hypothetical protein